MIVFGSEFIGAFLYGLFKYILYNVQGGFAANGFLQLILERRDRIRITAFLQHGFNQMQHVFLHIVIADVKENGIFLRSLLVEIVR